MAYTISDIVIKNPTRACMDRLRKIGVEKARRQDIIQKRWENGEFKEVEVIQVV